MLKSVIFWKGYLRKYRKLRRNICTITNSRNLITDAVLVKFPRKVQATHFKLFCNKIIKMKTVRSIQILESDLTKPKFKSNSSLQTHIKMIKTVSFLERMKKEF